jgi:hypothetical protein
MKTLTIVSSLLLALAQSPASEPGFVQLFNGKDFTGWKIGGNAGSFTIQDGAIVANGTPGHAYYDGPVGKTFRNFELKVDVMTKPNSNGGIYVMTEFQEKGWPSKGFEIQVNNTYKDPVKSGSLYHVSDIFEAPAKDNEWFTEHIIVQGDTITVRVNDKQTVQWTQPADWNGGREGPGRRLGAGTIALQAHDPGSTVYYKNIRIKPIDSARAQTTPQGTAGTQAPAPAQPQGQGGQPKQPMSFFITSVGLGKGANLGGLAGADAHCEALAKAVGAGDRAWRAYLSTQGPNGVNARDRIGKGPWFNQRGQSIARDLEHLHGDTLDLARMGNTLTRVTAISEKGEPIKGAGEKPNEHDILTGSQLDGRAFTDSADHTCNNWASDGAGSAQVGHHDRTGGPGTSWNSVHASKGCSQENLVATGGAGLFYCFSPGTK